MTTCIVSLSQKFANLPNTIREIKMTLKSICCYFFLLWPSLFVIMALWFYLFHGRPDVSDSQWKQNGTVETSNLFWHSIDVNPDKARGSHSIPLTVILNDADIDHFVNDKNKQAIVFLHGFPESALISWHKHFPRFHEEGYRIIAPDQRGYNTSYKGTHVMDYHFTELSEYNCSVSTIPQASFQYIYIYIFFCSFPSKLLTSSFLQRYHSTLKSAQSGDRIPDSP